MFLARPAVDPPRSRRYKSSADAARTRADARLARSAVSRRRLRVWAMQFALTDEEMMIRDAARRIAGDRLAPLAPRLDAGEGRAEFLDNLQTLARNGFMALNVAADHGGTDA